MDLFTRKDGTSIHYSTLGEGYPIVLIHTVLDNYSVFNKLAAELAKSFQVVLIDLRGHGYSDKPRHIEIKDFSDDIVELLKYLYIEEVALVCHEMGGIIGADISVRYPEFTSSLMLVNPTSIEDELPEERLFRKYAHIIRNWDPEKQDKFLNKRKYYRPRKMNRFLKHVVDTNEISTKEEIQAVKEVFKNADISQTYRNVVVPTKIIAGEFGERTTRLEAKEVADLIQNADFEVYQESSAFPFVEEQERFVEDTAAFINKHHDEKHV
ncbi:alpha/beta fold hydrolase [Staphylococcus aureus]|uniref:alpha/beta fold hydrolase n=1 Tax=Staphylococcus aureus TaxID=1280 RepID=UPI000E02A10B|nr:alpha/beta hydrolase [Staphylococcus aureus]SUK34173.1 3-oxoadipate enol-lactonase [Staphylococcus aureus]